MGYRVIVRFADLADGKYVYEAGDLFPRQGLTVSKERLAELAGSDNRIGKPIIEHIPDANEGKPAKGKGDKHVDRTVRGAKELV